MANQKSPSALEQSILTRVLSREKTANPAAVELFSYHRIIDVSNQLTRDMNLLVAMRRGRSDMHQINQTYAMHFMTSIPKSLRELKNEIAGAQRPLDTDDVVRMLTPIKNVATSFVRMMESLGIRNLSQCRSARLKNLYTRAATNWSVNSIAPDKAIDYASNVCDEILYNVALLVAPLRAMATSGAKYLEDGDDDTVMLEWGAKGKAIKDSMKGHPYAEVVDASFKLTTELGRILVLKHGGRNALTMSAVYTRMNTTLNRHIQRLKKEVYEADAPATDDLAIKLISPIRDVARAFIAFSKGIGISDITTCKTAKFKTKYMVLLTSWTPQQAAMSGKVYDYVKGVCDELVADVAPLKACVQFMLKNNQYKVECAEETPDDTGLADEDSVGSLMPITVPDEVLVKPELGKPDINEAFDALNRGLNLDKPVVEEAKPGTSVNKQALHTIENYAQATYKKGGYIPFSRMQVSKSSTTKALDKSTRTKGDLRTQVKVTTVTAKYKNKAICTIELSDADKDSGYKYALESSAINPEFSLSGWLAYVHLCIQYGFENEKLNRELEATVKDIQKNKFKTKDSTILEEATLGREIVEFEYDESGDDIMPFTTDIKIIYEGDEPMVLWEEDVRNPYMEAAGKSRYVTLDKESLQTIEKFASQNLKGQGYVPFKTLNTTTVQQQVKRGKNNVYTFLKISSVYKKQSVVTVIVWQDDSGVYQLMTSSISPKMTLSGFLAYVNICDKYNVITPQTNKKLAKYASQITEGKFRKKDRLILESEELFYDILAANGIPSVFEEEDSKEEWFDVWEDWDDDEVMTEAAKIDDDIAGIIGVLNGKGYTTVYSCSGHPSARLKSDIHRDGIKNGKLYSTARVVFDKDYNFGSYPKGWEPKTMDDGKFGIYVKGPHYNIVKGMQSDQFTNWKKRYMNALEKWASDLPSVASKK